MLDGEKREEAQAAEERLPKAAAHRLRHVLHKRVIGMRRSLLHTVRSGRRRLLLFSLAFVFPGRPLLPGSLF